MVRFTDSKNRSLSRADFFASPGVGARIKVLASHWRQRQEAGLQLSTWFKSQPHYNLGYTQVCR